MGYYYRGRYVEDASEQKSSPKSNPMSFRGRSEATSTELESAIRDAGLAAEEGLGSYELMCHCLNLGFSFNTLGDGSKVIRWNESGMPTKQVFSPQIALEAIRDWADAKHSELYPSAT